MARQNLDDLRRARKAAADTMAAVAARIGALEAAETPDAAALEAETAAFAAAEAAFARADAAVTRAAAVEAAQAAAAQGDGAGGGSGTGAAGADVVPAVASDPVRRGDDRRQHALVVGSSTDASFVDGSGATVSAFQNEPDPHAGDLRARLRARP
ncbi:hypothetical protein ORIO_23225 (plasmid) [Cereibacter azotoformans]|uniref:hypothetical protein n=1 Tax=Cereibacter azotoformans TaxID=43057 RepID=UPI00006652B8|nr:hypothetical protein [Cereibacter azotoformans]ULB12676.1 hypothetical protein ORIO_23225 [Cereibacter azotoformans]